VASARIMSVTLSVAETKVLLQEVAAYHTQINDVLLTALVQAHSGQGGSLLVNLEGHGREETTM